MKEDNEIKQELRKLDKHGEEAEEEKKTKRWVQVDKVIKITRYKKVDNVRKRIDTYDVKWHKKIEKSLILEIFCNNEEKHNVFWQHDSWKNIRKKADAMQFKILARPFKTI